MSDRPLARATVAVHAPLELPPVGTSGEQPNAAPLYQTAGWRSPDLAGNEAMADGAGYFYTRHGAPNSDAAAAAIARLEGAEAGVCFASGMAALAAVFLDVARPGKSVVVPRALYGGTIGLLDDLGRRVGLSVRWADTASPAHVAPLLDGDVVLVHVETLSNPLLRVADLAGLSSLCADRGVPLSVDSTFATPIVCRPLERGAHYVVHSATKFLGGHGDLSAGVVVGDRARMERIATLCRLHGALLDPFAAWLLQRGLRTLALRIERQSENAARLAARLAAHPRVARVHYPGRDDHPDRALAIDLLEGGGPMLAFDVGSLDAARAVFDRVRLVRRVASLGDLETMILHPATTSHRRVPPADRARAGITDGLLRLSVGIEAVGDVVEESEQALG